MKISIGILAYNEADTIAPTLRSLFSQSLLTDPSHPWQVEVVVVPNGCRDATAAVSEGLLAQLTASLGHGRVTARVCEVTRPGKSNAWNLFVHEFSDPAAQYLLLMDADILFIEPETLENVIGTLETTPDAWVSTDRPVKDVFFKAQKTWSDRLSMAASRVSGGNASWICGQLYGGRAEVLRQIWMPLDIRVEDGFLWMMIVTDGLRSPTDLRRVRRAEQASHQFEAYTGLEGLFKHERWQIVGNTINSLIYEEIQRAVGQDQPAGAYVAQRNRDNPRWVAELTQAAVESRRWRVIPRSLVFRRFRSLQNRSLPLAIALFPVVLAAFLLDLVIVFQALGELSREGDRQFRPSSQLS